MSQITHLIEEKLWAQVLFALFQGLVFGMIMGPEFGIAEKEITEMIAGRSSIQANSFLEIIQMIIVPHD